MPQLKLSVEYLNNKLAKDAVVTVTMSKETLYELATTNDRPDNSAIIVEGDIRKWQLFLWVQDKIDLDFNIMTLVSKK